MRVTTCMIVVAVLASTAACTREQAESAPSAAAAPAPAVMTALATTRQIMLGITAPTSDAVFGVGAQAPANDEDWEKVQASAISLAESANLLKIDGRRIDQPDWQKYVDTLVATSQAAAQAAQEKNADKVSEAGNQIYEVCDACHKQYMTARGGA